MASGSRSRIISNISGLPQKIIKFVKEAREELKKVSWPNRKTTVRYTVIVIASSVAAGLIIGGVDYLLTLILESSV